MRHQILNSDQLKGVAFGATCVRMGLPIQNHQGTAPNEDEISFEKFMAFYRSLAG